MISLKDLIRLKKKHPQIAPDMNAVLIRGLSPTQKRIFNLLRKVPCISSRELASQHDMIQTTAAQALREMRDMGLLDRKAVPSAGPNKYLYWRVA
ncbi:MAG: MarR family transcriptional regulator [Anaerolineaceae bacterium]|nr:MAG: MarR family transcriptional regulator [Anaerolineaceae bacterium]